VASSDFGRPANTISPEFFTEGNKDNEDKPSLHRKMSEMSAAAPGSQVVS
jgi:hypothetical protein